MRKKSAFTLAEVLITLAIIGVVAAISIPSVISNSQQAEFRTGLRKAVSVLNSAITMNIALDGESPYDNKDLFTYLQRHMSVIKSTTKMPFYGYIKYPGGSYGADYHNALFYTTDGMRFEFNLCTGGAACRYEGSVNLHESDQKPCTNTAPISLGAANSCMGCGSYGLASNPNNTTKEPCMILVDVNGDKKPTPKNTACMSASCAPQNKYRDSEVDGTKLYDIFSILITEDRAIPFGVAAQRAMYQAQKAK